MPTPTENSRTAPSLASSHPQEGRRGSIRRQSILRTERQRKVYHKSHFLAFTLHPAHRAAWLIIPESGSRPSGSVQCIRHRVTPRTRLGTGLETSMFAGRSATTAIRPEDVRNLQLTAWSSCANDCLPPWLASLISHGRDSWTTK